MNIKTLILWSFLSSITAFSSAANAGCTVEEIVKMAGKGSGKKIIEEKCDADVDDAPRCDFDRVVSLSVQRKMKSAIMRECGPCERPVCVLDSGFSCSLGKSAPAGIESLDACHCFTPSGPVMGEVLCTK